MTTSNDIITIKKLDYKETKDKFTIFNVPIIAELVQPYQDGYAFKSKDEIQKISVQNIPLTMIPEIPSHPKNFLGEVSNEIVADEVVGFMREPTKVKASNDSRKRYADFILFKNDLTQKLLDAYKSGKIIDTSIGFHFDKDETKGEHEGVKYDYIQRNIRLDHNAILMDDQGRIGMGRMPSPIGGIGADSSSDNKTIGGERMAEENKVMDELNQKVEGLQKEKDAVIAERDELLKSIDVFKTEAVAVKAEIDSLKTSLTEKDEKLKVYADKEKAVVDAMKAELKKANPEMDKLFDIASDDLIKEYHAKLLSKPKSRDIGADMTRTTTTPTSEEVTTQTWVDNAQGKKKK